VVWILPGHSSESTLGGIGPSTTSVMFTSLETKAISRGLKRIF
jgi:hypothetical protein